MAAPAAVAGDRVSGTCMAHQIPNPASGAPQPGPPFPFSAPVTLGLATRTLISGKPAVVVGASGLNVPPHVGLHPADPFFAPPMQRAQVVGGSATVLIEGKPAAASGATCTICFGAPGTLTGTAATVLIG